MTKNQHVQEYAGKKAKVVYDAETVEVWVDMKRIATHRRMWHDGYTTVPEHMPENHRAYAETKEFNAAYFLKKARQIGPETTAVINNILTSALFVQQSYRACQGVLRLASTFGESRLEAACKRIEPKTASSYKSVKSILVNNLDKAPVPESHIDFSYIPENDNVRGAEAYQ